MVISAVDYGKELGKEREHYSQSIKEGNESRKKELDHLDKTNDYKQRLASKNYQDSKHQMEKSFSDRMDEVTLNTKDTINKMNKEYSDKMLKERELFEKKSDRQKEDFNTRLDDITDSFRRANKFEKEEHGAIEKNNHDNYIHRIESMRQKQDDQLDYIHELAAREASDSQNRRRAEYANLSKEYQKSVEDLMKSETNRRLDEVRKKENEVRLTRNEAEVDRKLAAERQEDLLSSYKHKNDIMFEDIKKNMEHLTSKMQDKSVQNEKKLREDLQRRVDKIEELGIEEREDLHRRLKELSKEKSLAKANPYSGNTKSQDREDELRTNLKNVSHKFDIEAEKLRSDYTKDMDRVKKSSADREKEKLSDLNQYMTNTLDHQASENKKIMDAYRKKERSTEDFYNQAMDKLRGDNRKRIEHNIEQFNQEIETTAEKGREALSKQKDFYAERQNDIIKKNQQQVADLVDNMRNELNNKIEKTKTPLLEKLEKKNKENKELGDSYENKIEDMEHLRANENRYQNMVMEERHKNDMDILHNAVLSREKDTLQKMEHLKKFYDDKIDEIQKQNLVQTRKLLSESKRELSSQRFENLTKIRNIEKMAQKEKELLKSENLSQLNSIASSYENKIDRLKNSYENEIAKLKNKLEKEKDKEINA